MFNSTRHNDHRLEHPYDDGCGQQIRFEQLNLTLGQPPLPLRFE